MATGTTRETARINNYDGTLTSAWADLYLFYVQYMNEAEMNSIKAVTQILTGTSAEHGVMYTWLLWLMWKSTLAFTDWMIGCFFCFFFCQSEKRLSITVKWLIYCQEMGQHHKLWKFNSFLRILEFTGCVSQHIGYIRKPGDEIKNGEEEMFGFCSLVRICLKDTQIKPWLSNFISIITGSDRLELSRNLFKFDKNLKYQLSYKIPLLHYIIAVSQ